MDEVKKLSTAGKVVKFILLFTNTLVMVRGDNERTDAEVRAD